MGLIGEWGKKAGSWLGGTVGKLANRDEQKSREIGGTVGKVGGQILGAGASLLTGTSGIFKKGGRVKKTGKAKLHKGEFVLPKGVPPTKRQIKLVRKRGGKC